MNIGMDYGWFVSLEEAFRESMAWDEPNPGLRGALEAAERR